MQSAEELAESATTMIALSGGWSGKGRVMRGRLVDQSGLLLSYVDPEKRIPVNYPLRKIRALVREVLRALTHSFGKLHAREGQPSIPPEQMLSALQLRSAAIASSRFLSDALNNTHTVRAIAADSHVALPLWISRMRQCTRC